MATIKAYTDLEQSKVLAEILPLNSADYFYKYCIGHYNTIHYTLETYPYNRVANKNHDIPCWSLAALLNVLPRNLNIGRPSLESNYKGYYWLQYYDEFMKPNNCKTMCFNNPIDACYEMIIKLKERNLL